MDATDIRKAGDKAASQLRDINKGQDGDIEIMHINAVGVLTSLLREIGLGDVADEFNKIEKWYA